MSVYMRIFLNGAILIMCLWATEIAAQPAGYKHFKLSINKGEQYELWGKNHHPTHAHKRGRRLVKQDYVAFHIQTRTDKGKVLKSTFKSDSVVKQILDWDSEYGSKGFVEFMLLQMHEGDSAVFWIPASALREALKWRRMPPDIAQGAGIYYIIKVIKAFNDEEITHDIKAEADRVKRYDAEAIARYAAKSKRPYKRTFSGIWYYLTDEGADKFPEKDDLVSIRYHARTLDSVKIGSSDDEGRLFEFPVGGRFVMPALEEIILLMRKGAKGTFIIPCYMAYGKYGNGANIPPYTTMIMDVELVDIVLEKTIIENKGKILELERQKAKEKEKKSPTPEERQKQIEKDAKKRLINVKN